MTSLFTRWRNALLGLALTLIGLWLGAPALADTVPVVDTPSFADLQTAIASTKDPTRLSELQQLADAVGTSDDRAQITNTTSHNLGVFARYKKDPANSPADFYVLAPNHQTDDDYELVALLVPPQVALTWGESGEVAAAAKPRLLRILDGEQLELSDPETATVEGAITYALSLPAFNVTNSLDGVAEIPLLSQGELDLAPETAPLD